MKRETTSLTRRGFLVSAGALGLVQASRAAGAADTASPPSDDWVRPLVKFPQKRPLLELSPRPPLLETPFEIFDRGIFTPNDAFFVRWHLAGIPTTVDAQSFRIKVHGAVDTPLALSLDDLRTKFEPVEVAAVNQCSGNSRALFSPPIPGGQWYNGAMGNARWKGARLADVLAKAGLGQGVKQIRFNGLDAPVLPVTPAFVKALDVDVAREPGVLLAYEMNGSPLPLLNGYPVRLVVPGWFATYWVKMLSEIEAIETVDDGFWMKTAYRIPDTPDNSVTPDQTGYKTIPINRLRIRSFITNVVSGATLGTGPQTLRGIAFDSGSGIKGVDVSSDGGSTWQAATLGQDYGPYSFRQWQATFVAQAGTAYVLACRATANSGETQRAVPVWNPGGYLRNSIERYEVRTA